MSTPVLFYVTMPSTEAARALAALLIEKKCAACVNILPEMASIYEWDGAAETATEAVMIVKTNEATASAARTLIVDQHPYETPCVIALNINPALSHEPFLQWIDGVLNLSD